MFQRMIVGFDGTDTRADGLLLSTGLAKAFGSQITVAYVYGEEPSATSPEAERELADHADAALAGAREKVSQALAVTFCALPASSPARGLHELAPVEGTHMIVLGSRRLGPRTQRALGAVSEDVMRAAPCAAAVAPRGDHRDGGYVPQRIAVGWIPTTEGEQTLDVARRIARVTGGGVEVVAPTSARATVASLRARAHHAVERVVTALGVRWRSRSGLVSGRRLRS